MKGGEDKRGWRRSSVAPRRGKAFYGISWLGIAHRGGLSPEPALE
jgi:hypothetical protein